MYKIRVFKLTRHKNSHTIFSVILSLSVKGLSDFEKKNLVFFKELLQKIED